MARSNQQSGSSSSTCVAVELGMQVVRVVEVTGLRGDDAHVTRRGSAPLSPDFWSGSGNGTVQMLASALQQAVLSAGVTGKDVVVSLPRRMVTLRPVRLPYAPPEELRGMLAFEAQQYVLYPLEEVVLGYHLEPEAEADGMTTVLLAAARRMLVEQVMAAFKLAGLRLTLLTVSSLALAELIRDNVEPVALVSVERTEIDVVVTAGSRVVFTRASSVADAADDSLAREIARSISASRTELRESAIATTFLVGDAVTGNPKLLSALGDILEAPVSIYNRQPMSSQDADALKYASATGLALQTQGRNIARVNLIPEEPAELTARRQRSRNLTLGAVAAVAILIVGGMQVQSYLASSAKQHQEQVDANRNWNELKPRLKQRVDQDAKIAALYDIVNTGLDRAHPIVSILEGISGAMPDAKKIWLTDLTLQRGKTLTIRGSAMSAELATRLVQSLRASPVFSHVRLTFLGDVQQSLPAPAMPQVPGVTPLPGFGGPQPAVTVSPAAFQAGPMTGAPVVIQPGQPPIMPGGAPGQQPFMHGRRFGGSHGFHPGGGPGPGGPPVQPGTPPVAPPPAAKGPTTIQKTVTGFVISCDIGVPPAASSTTGGAS